MSATIRPATYADDQVLHRLDLRTWSASVSPAPLPRPGSRFFLSQRRPEDVLVAELEGAVVGWVMLGTAHPVESGRHVLMVQGLAVDPRHGRHGIGRQLMEAAIAEAKWRGARRLTLRVLGGNAPARGLYESLGFGVEGILKDEFLLAGEYVDDILMALPLATA